MSTPRRTKSTVEVRRTAANKRLEDRRSLTDKQQLDLIESRRVKGRGESKREKERLLARVNVARKPVPETKVDQSKVVSEKTGGTVKVKAKDRRAAEKRSD